MTNIPLSEYPKKDTVIEDTVATYDEDEPVDKVTAQKIGTKYDRRDMQRMGKVQELRRNFQFFSIFGYSVIIGATWEFVLITGTFTLTNGGTAGAIWMFLVVSFGMFFVMLSMAEMASIAPTAGGQYHWVSEFGPPKYQKFLSYEVGWMCVLGWQTAMVATGFAAAQQFEALIVLGDSGFLIKGWHGALLTMAVAFTAILFNTVLIRKLPMLEGVAILLHVFGFFAIVITLWVLAPRSDAKTVFTEFQDNAGWGNVGLACLVGMLGPVITVVGSDSSCHLSEELRDAAWILPRAMVATGLCNYVLGFIMTTTLMFTVGDISVALASPTNQPYVAVLQNATQSHGATVTLTSVMAILMFFCSVNQVTTSSRQLFAFARDGGLPFSKFLSNVRPGWDIPLNAVTVTMTFTTLLSFIIIGSTIAFNVLTTVSITGLVGSYVIAIGCIIHRRFRDEPFPPSRFNLGRLGLVVNGIALAFLALLFVMMFFPTAPNPNAQSMNWSCLIFGSTVIFSLIYYHFRGKYTYLGPVEFVSKNV